MVEAFITPTLIRWARERSRVSTDSAADKLNVKRDTLVAWETGAARPTLRQAQNIARKFNVPFGYLYLSVPPKESLPLPDLRTMASVPPRKPSPDFLDVLHDALRKLEWYRKYLEDENALPVSFIGRFNLGASPQTVAADMRATLGIDHAMRQKSKTWELFLTEFIRKAEEARVLVLRSSIVGSNTRRLLDVEEFRGFAISDVLAPLVFINAADAKAAQIFTIAHELAHLWIGQSGISNPDYRQRSDQQQNEIDRYCNSIAAEVLVPGEDFALRWNDFRTLDENVENLAERYRVSKFVILRRAYELGKVDADVYRTKYEELLEASRPKRADGGGDFYMLLMSRNSSRLTATLVVAAAEGRVTSREAASLLSVRIATLRGIEKHILAREPTNA